MRNQIFCSGGELQYRGKLCEIVYGQRTFTIEYYRNLIVLVISNVLSVRRFPPRWPGQCVSLSVSPSVTLCPDCVCSVARQSRASQLRRFQSSMGSLISRTHTVSTLGPRWPVSEGLLSLAIISSSRLITSPGPVHQGLWLMVSGLVREVWTPGTRALGHTPTLRRNPLKIFPQQIAYVSVFHDIRVRVET